MDNTLPSFSVGSTRDANIAAIAAKTVSAFPVGSTWDDADSLCRTAQDFGKANLFKARREGRIQIVCSRASNYNSKQKREGKRVITRVTSAPPGKMTMF